MEEETKEMIMRVSVPIITLSVVLGVLLYIGHYVNENYHQEEFKKCAEKNWTGNVTVNPIFTKPQNRSCEIYKEINNNTINKTIGI